ncbi:MAG: type III secretion system export apparatus subunit SctU [Archangiaceae bacterium]|nr:type III secretion system export apparatus subunit SctU [Archangiaceae bacterium]
MADSGGEKTEEATSKKVDDSRKQGQVWKSKDFTGVAVFCVGMAIVKAIFPQLEVKVSELFMFTIDSMSHPENLAQATRQAMFMGLIAMLSITVPIAGGAAVVGALVEFLQVGSLFTVDPLIPKLEKLNPIEGMKNLFSKKQIVELLKSMFKIGVTGYVVFGVVRDAMAMVVATIRGDTQLTMLVMGELVFRVSVRVVMLLLLFAIFDLWFQRHSYMKDLMMTKDEVKREYKESEGDPHHKAKRKEFHMEILEGAQMEAVKKADVVVTNPDHLAIALLYDKENDGAPRVIAKGMGVKAEAIKGLARDAEVAILRNVPLAHALHRVEVGQEIPEELYDAVAEVLNFVYQLESAAPAASSAAVEKVA